MVEEIDPFGNQTLYNIPCQRGTIGELRSFQRSWTVTGTIANGSNAVTDVSSSDIAKIVVGAAVANSNFPSGTTVSSISTNSFTVTNNATGSASGATITLTATFQCHCDAQCHVRMVTDPTGAVISRFDYDAWGNQLPSSFDGVPNGFFYRYVGGYGVRFDPATGLYYMRQRWYDPTTQRFISRDPIRSVNPYLYVSNQPVNAVDPSGQQQWTHTGQNIGLGGFGTSAQARDLIQPFTLSAKCAGVLQQMRDIFDAYTAAHPPFFSPLENVGSWFNKKYQACADKAGDLYRLFLNIPGFTDCFAETLHPEVSGFHTDVLVSQIGSSRQTIFDPWSGYRSGGAIDVLPVTPPSPPVTPLSPH